ncbi:T9SS type A sorting domain-containing protein [Siphonobacter sp. SORGH_AS_1065]|uniref:T9SS type A sorting domain-containing protein n=1 Tax=Siphonobacter sp. SORGH_AS_1065 TaxID=3041795 RepID=UPI0027858541|nr:T9SS type A sorting domain-containing protein [Siphonobacter sp. SORGH_AS_1065]MDQ1090290.1 hypothetical protein [Siphonobacter sp. SORGH_AS_1065]
MGYSSINCKFTYTITKGKQFTGNSNPTIVGNNTIFIQWDNTTDSGKLKVRIEKKENGVTCPIGEGIERELNVNIRYIGEGNPIQLNGSTLPTNSIINCGTSTLTFSTTPVQTQFPVNANVNYAWSIPSGWTINSGQGSTSINVTPSLNTGGPVTFTAKRTDQGFVTKQKQTNVTRNIPTTPVINSNDLIVCSNKTITATSNNATSYIWGKTGGANIVSTSGNSATINGTSDGTVFVAAYSSLCNITTPNSNSVKVIASPPTADISIKDDFGQNAPNSMSCGYGLTLHATHPKAQNYVWSYSGNIGSAYTTDYGNGTLYFNSYVNDCYGLTVNASNCFGSATSGVTICINDCYSGFSSYSVYPNPARETVNIQFDNSGKSLPDQVELIDEVSQKVIMSKPGSKNSDNAMVLDVQKFPRGRYILRVMQKKDLQKPQTDYRVVLQ